MTASAAGHPEDIGKFSVARDMRADKAVAAAVAMPQDGGARAIAEKDTGIALRPIGDRGQFFRADYEHGVVGVAGDELLRDFDREEESSAGRRDVEAGRFCRADLRLNKAGGRGKHHVRRGRGDEDQIDFISCDPRLFHCGERGLGAHIAGVFVVRGDAALLDAGAGGDPLVIGLDDLGEIVVRENFFRHVAAGADDRDSALRFSGPRARARRSFHYSG